MKCVYLPKTHRLASTIPILSKQADEQWVCNDISYLHNLLLLAMLRRLNPEYQTLTDINKPSQMHPFTSNFAVNFLGTPGFPRGKIQRNSSRFLKGFDIFKIHQFIPYPPSGAIKLIKHMLCWSLTGSTNLGTQIRHRGRSAPSLQCGISECFSWDLMGFHGI